MIASLKGVVQAKSPGSAVVDVGGVGYALSLSLHSFCQLPEVGEPVALHIHTHVREDAFTLFAFIDIQERQIFEALIGINKVGPKLALNILSGITSSELIEAIVTGDVIRLSAIPGIGKKTAERLTLELADRFAHLEGAPATTGVAHGSRSVLDDTVEAMMSLGYKKVEAERAAQSALKTAPDESLETILKMALQSL